MNWDAIGAIGEVVGAIAVVLTLLYLARETAKNSKSIDATSSRSISLQLSEFNREVARDPVLSELFYKSYQLTEQEYTEKEWFKFKLAAISLVQIWQAQIMHGNLGLGDDEEVNDNIDFANYVINTFPTWKKFWNEAKGSTPSTFVETIENRARSRDHGGIFAPHNKSED